MTLVQAERARVRRSRSTFWRASDLRLAPTTARRVLAELADAGYLVRMTDGLYWRGNVSVTGMDGPSPDALWAALECFGPGIGPAGSAAATYLGIDPRPNVPYEVAVPRVCRRIGSAHDAVRLIGRPECRRRETARCTPIEIAVFELFRPNTGQEVQWFDAWDRLVDIVRAGRARADRLQAGSADELPQVRRLVAVLLRHAGHADLVARARD